MTEPYGPGHVLHFWPVWARTLDAMVRSLARARSRCRRCGTLLHVDLETLSNQLGGSASLIDQSDACTVVGCGGTVYYLGAPATGAAYYVLIDNPALMEGVSDPVGLPFQSRWHGMVLVGAKLASPAPTAVMINIPPLSASKRR